MSAGAVSRVVVSPDPPDSGTTLQVVEDEGARFLSDVAALPFTAIVFPVQEIPVYGVNAEKISVTDIEKDTLTFARGDQPIAITNGLQIAVLSEMVDYDYGSIVTIVPPAGASAPHLLDLREPSGKIATVDLSAEGGTASYSLAATPAGVWHYRWTSDGVPQPEQRFFARYSSVLP